LRHDPLAAQRTLEAYFGLQRERSRTEHEQLWQRASVDQEAAAQLHRAVREDLAAHRDALAAVEQMVPRWPGMATVVGEIEGEILSTEQDLAKVGHLLARSGKGAHGAVNSSGDG